MKRYCIFFLIPFLYSCGLYPSVPMEKMEFRAGEKPAKHLVVLLSGGGAKASYFKDQQWVELARQQGVKADFVAPYAHVGYYMTREITTRLHEDIILPAKQMGYESISLAGISMGGLGSLLYSDHFPEEIDRLYLFAPYLGNQEVHNEIRGVGGLSKWQIRKENEDDYHHFIWRRLKQLTQDEPSRNKLFLGYGDQDSNRGIDLLQTRLPEKHVITTPGGHKDVVFTQLWKMMLEKGFLDFDKRVVVKK